MRFLGFFFVLFLFAFKQHLKTEFIFISWGKTQFAEPELDEAVLRNVSYQFHNKIRRENVLD